MTKQSGLGDGLVVDGIDLSGDTGSLQAIGGSRPTTNVTGINKSGVERLHLIRDGRIDWSSWFNPDNAHDELSPLPTTNRIITYLRGQALGNSAASLVAKQLNYDPNRNTDGSLTIGLQARANGFGLDWGRQITTGLQVFSGAGNGTGVDFAASTNFGLQAYLHVVAFTGTGVDVEITDSADDSTYASIGSGVSFPTAAGVVSARIQTDRDETIRRYLRAELTGTFSSATVLVAVTKNTHQVLL